LAAGEHRGHGVTESLNGSGHVCDFPTNCDSRLPAAARSSDIDFINGVADDRFVLLEGPLGNGDPTAMPTLRCQRGRRGLPKGEHRLRDLVGRRLGKRGGGLLKDEQSGAVDLTCYCLAVADGEERVAASVDDEGGDVDLGQALAPSGFAVELGEHCAQLVGHVEGGRGAWRAVPDARRDRPCGDRVITADLRASSGEVGNRVAVGPVGHGDREQAAHRRLVMVWEVSVRLARRHWARAGQGERRERGRMVESGDLGDHPTDAGAGEVRWPAAERIDKGGGVGGEVPKCVRGFLRVCRCRLAAVAQVVANDPPPTGGESHAQRIRPRLHRRPAREQHEWSGFVAEGLNAERDTVGVDGRHST